MQLVLMCGIPGCGKSTVAKAKYGSPKYDYVILSSDELRGVIGKDESDQSVSRAVFQFLEAMTEILLRQGKSVVIDATNIARKNRAKFLQIGAKYGAQLIAEVVKGSIAIVKRGNISRARVVPEHVIDDMAARWEEPTEQEFHKIIITERT